MAMKIVRALQFSVPTSARHATYVYRLMYEFWGYIVHAPTTVTTPGGVPGFAYTTFPTNALEGTTVLATGADGVTTVDQVTFDSAGASFTNGMVGKYLVVWDSTTPGQEDGIYKITSRLSATQITVNVLNGGSPHPVTLRPRFTSRSSLKYRIVDVEAVAALPGWAVDQYFVMQMTPSISNPGQANSQVQWLVSSSSNGLSGGRFSGSPAGTWNGSAFTDGTAAVTTTSNSGLWANDSGSSTAGVISMWGDKDGLVAWFKFNGATSASYCHLEAPIRLASQAQDPNPLAIANEGVCTLYLSSVGNGYNNFHMAGTDGVIRRHTMMVKCMSGEGIGENSRPTGTINFFGDSRIAVSPPYNKTFLSRILLGQTGSPSSQYNLARAFIRYARVCPNQIPPWTKLGSSGEFFHIQNGICFPWDDATLGTNMIPFGY